MLTSPCSVLAHRESDCIYHSWYGTVRYHTSQDANAIGCLLPLKLILQSTEFIRPPISEVASEWPLWAGGHHDAERQQGHSILAIQCLFWVNRRLSAPMRRRLALEHWPHPFGLHSRPQGFCVNVSHYGQIKWRRIPPQTLSTRRDDFKFFFELARSDVDETNCSRICDTVGNLGRRPDTRGARKCAKSMPGRTSCFIQLRNMPRSF